MAITTGEILRRLKSEPIHRTFAINRAAVSEDARTVSLAFASGSPIDHWFGQLRLSMNTKAMRSGRLDSGAPLLLDHDPTKQIGIIENYSLAGGIARATVRFSRSELGNEIFQDVKDGIRKSVSVGFLIHKMHVEKQGDPTVYRSDDWEPFEVSVVSIPADISVGVGRSIGAKKIMNEEDFQNPQLAVVREINEWGKIYKLEEAARSYSMTEGATVAGFMEIARKNSPLSKPGENPTPRLSAQEEAYRQGAPQYYGQLARSIPRVKLTAFTGEDAERRAYRFGQFILGGPMGNRAAAQWCQQNGVSFRAAQVEGVNEKGGYLVPEEFGNDIVQLMERYGVYRQHAKVVPMASDRRTDPVLNDELDSTFVGEMTDPGDQDLDFGLIGFTAHKHMVLVPFSSEVSEDSSISIGDQLAGAASRAFAKKEDLCGFIGDATSTYGGMTGITTALKSVDGTIGNIQGLQVGSGNAYSELVLTDFEGVVGRLPDYADIGNAKWFVSRKFYFNVMVKLILSGTPTATEIEDARNRKFLGYPVVFSQVMPSTEANSQVCAIFGDLSQGSRLGDRRMFTFAIDDSILFRKDALLARATARFDVNNSFGVGDTTAAGPIVGLITAAS